MLCFLNKIVLDKEKSILYNNVERKRLWGQQNKTPPTTQNVGLHPEKEMLGMWWDSKDILYSKFLSENQLILATTASTSPTENITQWKSARISQQNT